MARFDFDDLMKKEQAELDRIKTALEIYQSEDKYAFERKKVKTENLRFFAIAIMTAVISLGSSYFIEYFKQTNVDKEDVKKEFSDLKKSYFTVEKEKQNDIACELSHFNNSIADKTIETSKANFEKICKSSVAIQNQTQTIVHTDISSTAVKGAIEELGKFDKQLQELKRQANIANATEQPKIIQKMADVNKQIDQVVNRTPEIQSAVKSTETIEQNVKIMDAADDNVKLKTSSGVGTKTDVTWFKEGYFLQFGDYRVLLQSLDKKEGIHVEVCRTKTIGTCSNPIVSNVLIGYNKPLEFTDNGNHYRINLESIEHAGKNPFNLAAYITFETTQ